MSELSKQALKVENNQSFPNNNAGLITPTALRTFNEDMIDSTVNQAVYTTDSASFDSRINNITGSAGPLPSGVVSGSSQIILQDTTGDLSGSRIDGEVALALNSTYAQNTITTGKNLHSTTIAKGTPLFFTGSGTAGNLVGVYPADAGNPDRMPAGGIAGESLAVGAEGIVLLDGYIGGVDTSIFASGDEIFVGVGGGYTNVAPTGSALIQHLGNVEKSAVNGSGVIQMMGEVRGLPNLQSGYAWVGDSNGVPQAVSTGSWGGGSIDTGSFATTGSNTFTGTQTIQSGTTKTSITNTEVFFQEGFDAIETRMTRNGLLLNDNSGTSALVLSAAPYNLFSLGISDYNGNLRGLFYNTGSNTSTPTLPILGVLNGANFDDKAYLMLDTVLSGSLTTNNDVIISASASEPNHLFIQRSTTGAQQFLRLGPDDNQNNFGFVVTGSDQTPGQQVWGINVQGGVWQNGFDAPTGFGNFVTFRSGIDLRFGGGQPTARMGVNYISESVEIYTGLSSNGTYIVSSSVDERILEVNPTTATVAISNTISSQIFLNPQVLTGTQTVPSGFNGMITGPVSNAGTIVVESGSTLVII